MTDNELTDKWSLYSLLMKYYAAKASYYASGTSNLTDLEYDWLEVSMIAIHGPDVLKTYGCVGYDQDKHDTVKSLYNQYNSERNKRHEIHNSSISFNNVN